MHNHLGVVETTEQIEEFMENCPGTGLLLDVGHLAAAGGDPLYITEKYFDRLYSVHIKYYTYLDKNGAEWWQRLRFCEPGAGELKESNREFLALLQKKGYRGWILVEHDSHLRDPLEDLAVSREYIRSNGL